MSDILIRIVVLGKKRDDKYKLKKMEGVRKNTEITVVYSFNDKYAKLASVSMTSLVLNTKRVCNIHIFENSISKETSEKILKLENMYENAFFVITLHGSISKM